MTLKPVVIGFLYQRIVFMHSYVQWSWFVIITPDILMLPAWMKRSISSFQFSVEDYYFPWEQSNQMRHSLFRKSADSVYLIEGKPHNSIHIKSNCVRSWKWMSHPLRDISNIYAGNGGRMFTGGFMCPLYDTILKALQLIVQIAILAINEICGICVDPVKLWQVLQLLLFYCSCANSVTSKLAIPDSQFKDS